jgi:hypothetical protein
MSRYLAVGLMAIAAIASFPAIGCSGGASKLTHDEAVRHSRDVIDATRTAILPPFGSGQSPVASGVDCVADQTDPSSVASNPSAQFRYDVEPSDDVNAMVAKAISFWRSRGFEVTGSGIGTDNPSAVAFEKVSAGAYEYVVSVAHETPPSLLIAGTIPCAVTQPG